jgi:hypothetical protein
LHAQRWKREVMPDRISIILQVNQQVVCKEENKKFTPKTERNYEFDKIINKQPLLEKRLQAGLI